MSASSSPLLQLPPATSPPARTPPTPSTARKRCARQREVPLRSQPEAGPSSTPLGPARVEAALRSPPLRSRRSWRAAERRTARETGGRDGSSSSAAGTRRAAVRRVVLMSHSARRVAGRSRTDGASVNPPQPATRNFAQHQIISQHFRHEKNALCDFSKRGMARFRLPPSPPDRRWVDHRGRRDAQRTSRPREGDFPRIVAPRFGAQRRSRRFFHTILNWRWSVDINARNLHRNRWRREASQGSTGIARRRWEAVQVDFPR